MREIPIPPKPAKTRYGCSFCKKTTARKETMERHEVVCYYNPNRVCPICDGSGRIQEWHEDGFLLTDDECSACKVAKEVTQMKQWMEDE